MTVETIKTVLLVIAAIGGAASIAYWLWQAHRKAMSERRSYEPPAKSTRSNDDMHFQAHVSDAAIEADWRWRVSENIERRSERTADKATFLMKQAD